MKEEMKLEFICRGTVIEAIPYNEKIKCACALQTLKLSRKEKQFKVKVYLDNKPYSHEFDVNKYIKSYVVDATTYNQVETLCSQYEETFNWLNIMFFFMKLSVSQCNNAAKFISSLHEGLEDGAIMMEDFIINQLNK